jgi:hypothetical protein
LANDRDSDQGIGKVIKLSISLLEQEKQVLVDDAKMAEITSEGLDSLCKRQRSATE